MRHPANGRPATARMAIAALFFVASMSACDDGGNDARGPSDVSPTISDPTPAPDSNVTLQGNLTLDGAPLDADFLGVRVIRDGLTVACQDTIPAVTDGRYEIGVVADAEIRGCGAPGAELLLWAYANDRFIFSTHTTPWPEGVSTVRFDANFSSDAPEGASQPVTEFKGHLFDRDGTELPGGTIVEAFVGDVQCGVTSLRYGDENEGYYTLFVSGPASVTGCDQDATLTFRLDDRPAAQEAVNDLERSAEGHELDLTVR